AQRPAFEVLPENDIELANPTLVPRIGAGHLPQSAVDDFVTPVILEPIILLVGPTFGLLFQYACHGRNLVSNPCKAKSKRASTPSHAACEQAIASIGESVLLSRT